MHGAERESNPGLALTEWMADRLLINHVRKPSKGVKIKKGVSNTEENIHQTYMRMVQVLDRIAR